MKPDLVAEGSAPATPVARMLALGHIKEGVRLQQRALVEGLVRRARHGRRVLQLILVEVLQPHRSHVSLHSCDIPDQCCMGCCSMQVSVRTDQDQLRLVDS